MQQGIATYQSFDNPGAAREGSKGETEEVRRLAEGEEGEGGGQSVHVPKSELKAHL